MFKLLLLSASVVSLFSLSAFAAQSEYLHQTRLSTRVMGMGGAFTAVADDYNALYYNPAGLAWLDHGQFVADLGAGFTPSILGFISDLNAAGSDPNQLQTLLAKNFGSHFSSRVQLGGTWVRPHWGFGLQPVDLTVEADIHGVGGATVGVQAYQDTILQYGYGWSWGAKVENQDSELTTEAKVDKQQSGKSAPTVAGINSSPRTWAVGVSPKAVYRAYFEKDLSALDLAASNTLFRPSDATEGITFDTDVGMLYNLPIPDGGWFKWLKYAKPTFGVAVRNVLDLGFKTDLHLYNAQSVPATANLERRFDVGTKFELPEFWVFKPRFMVDARDMGTRYASTTKCLHLGTELLWKAFSWLNGGYRLGLSEGYLTMGVSAELGIFLIDLASYSENIGTSADPKESRRYMAQLSLDF